LRKRRERERRERKKENDKRKVEIRPVRGINDRCRSRRELQDLVGGVVGFVDDKVTLSG